MPRQVAVLFVHGINVSTQDYAERAIQRIKNKLPKALRSNATFYAAFWADIVRPHQRAFFEKARNAADLKQTLSRRLALEGLGDAAAYQKTPKRFDAPYFQIQRKVREAIEALDTPGDPARPLIVIGHSLGCHILSSFIWDVNNIKQYTSEELAKQEPLTREFHAKLIGGSPFCRLDTLAGIVTLGSNMPLFTFTFERHNVIPITKAWPGKIPAFPGRALTSEQARKARWLNFYSRNDLLAYPLKPLYDLPPEYDVLSDIPVCSEGWLKAPAIFSPLNAFAAHTGYDRNRTVVKATARMIQDVIETA